MTYTFAKVLNELSPILSTETFSKGEVIETLQRLQKEYAQTIEMTKEQYEALMYYKRNEDNYANPLAQLLLSLYEDVGGGDDWGLYDGWDVDEESELVLYVEAWKRPETIKVVDE